MEFSLNFFAFIDIVAATLGVLSGIIILYYGIKSNPANQPLAIGLIVYSTGVFYNFLLASGLIFHWPHFYRLGHVTNLILLPMFYLFVAFHTRNRLWKWYDLLHAIPLVIFLIDYGHVFLMSSAEKLLILEEEANNLDLLAQFRQSKYIGPGFHENARSILFSLYWIAEVILFIQWTKPHRSLPYQKRVLKNWILVFLVFQLLFMVLPGYLRFFGLITTDAFHTIYFMLTIWLVFSSFSLFFFPSILYGDLNTQKSKPNRSSAKIENHDTQDIKLNEVFKMIDSKMDELQLYRKQGYSIHDLSRDLDIPAYQISKSLNILNGMSFVDYINKKRIDHCIHKFGKREWELLTFEAMASECGFSNRNTFTRTFKKFQGCYPSDFKKNLEYPEALNQ